MIDYDSLKKKLKEEIQSVCDNDPYGLSPQSLYKNIYRSSGSDKTLAKIFEVSPQMIKDIKDS